MNSFPAWKHINIGTHTRVEELIEDILAEGFRIGDWARDILTDSAFSLAKRETTLTLVRVAVSELDFKKGAYRKDIYERAHSFGLKLCPLETGPQLHLQYKDQPRLESLQIGMEPQTDATGHESEFRVVHGGDNFLWLVGDHKHPEDFWKADEYFIFMK